MQSISETFQATPIPYVNGNSEYFTTYVLAQAANNSQSLVQN